MDLETLREYLLGKKASTEGFPFGEDILVFKVLDKMFALVPLEAFPLRINLKCEPEKAIELRTEHEAILPGYHQNKKHWNTILLDGSLNADFVESLVDHSYERVVQGMTKKKQRELDDLE